MPAGRSRACSEGAAASAVSQPRAAAGRIRGVLFDKDGTLLDFDATWLPAYRAAAAALAANCGCPQRAVRMLAETGYDESRGRCAPGSPLACATNREIVERWCEVVTGPVPDGSREHSLKVMHAAAVAAAAPLTDLGALCDRLAGGGLALGVATMDSIGPATAMLDALGVLGRLDFLCGGDSGYGEKPGPGMVHAFCAASGLDPAAVAVVGDTTHDLGMGRAAGAGLVVGVLSGAGTVDTLAPLADHVVSGIDAFADLVLGDSGSDPEDFPDRATAGAEPVRG